MAKGNNPPENKPHRRSFKAESYDNVKLEEGMEVSGILRRVRKITITDKTDHMEKDIQQYVFDSPLGDGERFGLLGRYSLDAAFDEMFEQVGGRERIYGKVLTIVRGKDEKLKGNRTMGTYEIFLDD